MKNEPTLVIQSGQAQWVTTLCDALIHEICGNWLENKGHVGSGAFVRRNRLLSPECVDVFVQLRIDLGGCPTIVMTWDLLAADFA